jgi:hypothetical protein
MNVQNYTIKSPKMHSCHLILSVRLTAVYVPSNTLKNASLFVRAPKEKM